MTKKRFDVKRLVIKLLLCTVYLVIITLLFMGGYKQFRDKHMVFPWEDAESVRNYSYMTVTSMSEEFAYYEDLDIGFHFIIEATETGEWHTYVVAVDENNLGDLQKIIDYTYLRTSEHPEPVEIYGYPTVIPEELKEYIVNNINYFLPAQNQVEITMDNVEDYVTNCFLDTTDLQNNQFDITLCITLLLLAVMILLFIFTLFDRDSLVDNIEERVEEIEYKTRRVVRFKPLHKTKKDKDLM